MERNVFYVCVASIFITIFGMLGWTISATIAKNALIAQEYIKSGGSWVDWHNICINGKMKP